ncbi:MAG: VOC family protein [Streptosporangiaceae bacterium]
MARGRRHSAPRRACHRASEADPFPGRAGAQGRQEPRPPRRLGGRGARREQADRLVARGATFLHSANQGQHEWVTLTDPEGNEFCIS